MPPPPFRVTRRTLTVLFARSVLLTRLLLNDDDAEFLEPDEYLSMSTINVLLKRHVVMRRGPDQELVTPLDVDYLSYDAHVKAAIVWSLCDKVAHTNPAYMEHAGLYDAGELRIEPLATDSSGGRFYYFAGNADCKVYRQTPDGAEFVLVADGVADVRSLKRALSGRQGARVAAALDRLLPQLVANERTPRPAPIDTRTRRPNRHRARQLGEFEDGIVAKSQRY